MYCACTRVRLGTTRVKHSFEVECVKVTLHHLELCSGRRWREGGPSITAVHSTDCRGNMSWTGALCVGCWAEDTYFESCFYQFSFRLLLNIYLNPSWVREVERGTVCCGNHKKRRPNQGENPTLMVLGWLQHSSLSPSLPPSLPLSLSLPHVVVEWFWMAD